MTFFLVLSEKIRKKSNLVFKFQTIRAISAKSNIFDAVFLPVKFTQKVMKEEFLSFLWKNRLLNHEGLVLANGEGLEIIHPGTENPDAGPDYFSAKIRIGSTIWAGNIEIHLKSSDWIIHKHHLNEQYGNIILHLVHENDCDLDDIRQKNINVLEIKNYYDRSLFERYENLLKSKSWIPCQNQIGTVDGFVVRNWLGRLMVERLEGKSQEVSDYFDFFKNDWEQTFFYFLSKNLGFRVNSVPFGMLAQRTPYLLLQKNSDDLQKLEAILFGQAGLLSENIKDVYARILQKEYTYQKAKYNLEPIQGSLWKFSKLRPVNFPTIRISQIAAILHGARHIFRNVVESQTIQDIHSLFSSKVSDFWENHYTFEKESPKRTKRLGAQSIHNIIINTIAPILFVYGRQTNNEKLCEKALEFLNETPPEDNSIIQKWSSFGIKPVNASESQALLELHKFYCTPRRCLDCHIGVCLVRPKKKLLSNKSQRVV